MRCSLQALAAATLVLSSTGVLAGGLLDAYLAARANDPTFRAARYEREAGQQAIAIGRSSLLPVVAISASYSKNRGERESTTNTRTEDLDYADKQAALTLRQPLFNYEAFVRYQQGGVQAAYSDAVFDRKEGEMTVKLAAAYFEALFSGERLTLAEAEITAYEAQRELAQRRRKGGEGTVTEVAEAESRMQLARAGRADAADRLLVATHALAVMTGKPSGRLWVLRPDFVAPALQPAGIEEWLALAENNSPELRARRKAFELAGLDIERIRAGHLPQLDLVARASRSENETISTLNQRTRINSLGVQLNIPVYAGGRVSALAEQAVANRERTRAELEAVTTEVQLEVRRQFLAAVTGIDRIGAYQKAVEASRVASEGTKRGMAAGIRTNTDVLDAERQMFVAQRDLAQARYEFLVGSLRLKLAAGVLAEKDIAEIEKLLRPDE